VRNEKEVQKKKTNVRSYAGKDKVEKEKKNAEEKKGLHHLDRVTHGAHLNLLVNVGSWKGSMAWKVTVPEST
jgi:hypothetical protein